MTKPSDFKQPYLDTTGEWIVEEELKPEARGQQCHRFPTYEQAFAFYCASTRED